MKMQYIIVVFASLQGVLGQGLRNTELTTAVQELTLVLRGIRSDLTSNFEKLLSDLHQDRLARTEQSMALRDKVEENRLGVEVLRGQISKMATGKGCPTTLDILPTGGGVGGKPHDVGVKSGGGGGTQGGVGPTGGEARGAGAGGGGGGRVVVDSRRAKSSLPRGLDAHYHQEKGDEESETPDAQVTTIRECPTPFQRAGKHCLAMLRERASWDAARSRCHAYAQSHVSHLAGSTKVNGDLVVPHDMPAFENYIETLGFRGQAWVGASTEGWGGMWAWIDGSLIKELPWLYSKPGLTGSLLAVDHEGNFHTVLRRHTLYPICELT